MIQMQPTDPEQPIRGYSCSATLTKEVTRCGFNSITYGTTHPVWGMRWPITPDECRLATETLSLMIEGRSYEIEIV